jgi:hypothetical protein
MFKEKYLKYKNKYINLKKQLGGEPATILYHGTSSYHFDSIKTNGIPGRFPEDLLQDIKILYDAGYGKMDDYVSWFLERQENLTKNKLSLSLTGQLSVAEEYSSGARKGSEGLSRMLLSLIGKTLTPELQMIANKLSKVSRYPGIILVVKIDDIKDDIERSNDFIPEDDKSSSLGIDNSDDEEFSPPLNSSEFISFSSSSSSSSSSKNKLKAPFGLSV